MSISGRVGYRETGKGEGHWGWGVGSVKWEVPCGRRRLDWEVVRLGNLVKQFMSFNFNIVI